ncbi:hypothetical protein GCM10008090_01230 [Arenicella chitinivorans]|uniref:Barstar (barnase inhibitor) domain-containing protein n=1 Tax=Arenicella chitinivorans TaxID=1329800 RepID=A0A918RHQ4_9GAMM|nr:barstar family protein [Arenicella chitinivorans]GGZ96748.1 hypothetical protein GCM10008090_01230 [Arenicella chitinivorans]
MKVIIDWSEIQSPDDYFSQLLPQVGAPDWHGRNLNALADSLVTGGINKLEPPFCLINLQTGSVPPELQDFVTGLNEIYDEASSNGRKISVFSE